MKHSYVIKASRNGVSVNYPVCKTNNEKYANSKIKEKKTSLKKCLRSDCDLFLMVNGLCVKKIK